MVSIDALKINCSECYGLHVEVSFEVDRDRIVLAEGPEVVDERIAKLFDI